MKNCHKNLIMAVALTLLSAAPYCSAQTLNDRAFSSSNSVLESNSVNTKEFKLNTVGDELPPSKTKALVKEFKLSLGSQMLDYQKTSKVSLSDAEHIETGYKGIDSISLDNASLNSSSISELGSVITLNNSYETNSIGFSETNITGMRFTAKAGRLDLSGAYSQSSMLVAGGDSDTGNNTSVMGSARASVDPTRPVSEDSATKSIEASLSSDYYLEAVYNFKPTFKGKVAFQKSMIDTFDSKANVKFEGIVEATSDVSIKAGYSEENRSDAVDTQTPKETKVYTEFILKF